MDYGEVGVNISKSLQPGHQDRNRYVVMFAARFITHLQCHFLYTQWEKGVNTQSGA